MSRPHGSLWEKPKTRVSPNSVHASLSLTGGLFQVRPDCIPSADGPTSSDYM